MSMYASIHIHVHRYIYAYRTPIYTCTNIYVYIYAHIHVHLQTYDRPAFDEEMEVLERYLLGGSLHARELRRPWCSV